MSDFDDRIRQLAGSIYRIERAEDGIPQIPLRGGRGAIYQHSNWRGEDTLLAAHIETDRPMQTFKSIRRQCPEAKIHQLGEDGIIILHPVRGWEKFAEAVGAKTRRRLSDNERQERSERLRQFQFPPASQNAPVAPESVLEARVGS